LVHRGGAHIGQFAVGPASWGDLDGGFPLATGEDDEVTVQLPSQVEPLPRQMTGPVASGAR